MLSKTPSNRSRTEFFARRSSSEIDYSPEDLHKTKTDSERRVILDARVTSRMMTGHRRLIYRSDFCAVFLRGKKVTHLLHLIATPLTFGFWAYCWLYHVKTGGERREMMEVSETGVVHIWTAGDQDVTASTANAWMWILLIPWILIAISLLFGISFCVRNFG